MHKCNYLSSDIRLNNRLGTELRTQTIVYSTLKLQMISKVDILVNHKNIWGSGDIY